MKDDKPDINSIIGFILIGLVLFYFLTPQLTEQTRDGTYNNNDATEKVPVQQNDATRREAEQQTSENGQKENTFKSGTKIEIRKLDLQRVSGSFSNDGRLWRSIILKNYNEAIDRKVPLQLFSHNGDRFFDASYRVDGIEIPASSGFEISRFSDEGVELVFSDPKFEIRRMVTFLGGGYVSKVSDKIINRSDKKIIVELTQHFYQSALEPTKTDESKSGLLQRMKRIFGAQQQDILQFVVLVDGSSKRLSIQANSDFSSQRFEKPIDWAGVEDKYFFIGALPIKASIDFVDFRRQGQFFVEQVHFFPQGVEKKESVETVFNIYHGPKEINYLSSAGPALEKAIDYGDWIGFIARPLLRLLLFLYGLIPNYGVAILILTLIVKIILFPLNQKQYKSMKGMQKLQPLMAQIKEKFKSDKQRMNLEMMKLYKEHKVNPMGGCLPLLVQMPIFFALYRLFGSSIEFRQSPFVGWIRDLSVPDPYLITPVLMGIAMYIQQKITPVPQTSADSDAMRIQQKMMQWMPIIFTAFMLFLPAGLCLYILLNAVLSIAQQKLLMRD